MKLAAAGYVVAGNQLVDDWPPQALVDVSRRRSPSTLISDEDYDDVVVDKRYMRFGRRASDDADQTAAKRYMRFGRAHFHPLMGLDKRYMRFGRR